jgi:hypothetical protein
MVAAAFGGPNLIRNPGFEEGVSPTYPGVGRYWETNDAQPHPDVDVLTTTTRHTGSCSQWLKANPAWDLGMVRQFTAYNSITPGKTYRISAWIKTANVRNPAGWYVFGAWVFNNDTYLGDSKMPQQETLNYDWREISWTVVAPTGVNRMAVVLTRHTDGDAWYDDVSVTEVAAGSPAISPAPSSLTHKVLKGSVLADDFLELRNSGGGTLNYAVAVNAGWLTCAPIIGNSTGEIDQITIHYNVAALPVGHYSAAVTISDPAAVPPSVVLPVSVTLRVPCDLDYDGDVDQSDFGLLQGCYSGSDVAQDDPACADARLDGDADVDQDDLATFFGCLSGPQVPSDPGCAG